MSKKKFKTTPRKWIGNKPEILQNNSTEYVQMMTLAYDNRIYNQVLHNGHISLELIIKAAFCKYKGKQPYGHDIFRLVGYTINSEPIFKSIHNDPNTNIRNSFSIIYAAWDMQYRYREHRVQELEAKQYLNAFEEAYKWIKTKYLN